MSPVSGKSKDVQQEDPFVFELVQDTGSGCEVMSGESCFCHCFCFEPEP